MPQNAYMGSDITELKRLIPDSRTRGSDEYLAGCGNIGKTNYRLDGCLLIRYRQVGSLSVASGWSNLPNWQKLQ